MPAQFDDFTLRLDEDLTDGQRNMDLDVELGQLVAHGELPPTARVWLSSHAGGIGVSRRDVSTSAGESAAEHLRRSGQSVVVRHTGGTAVPQGDGVMHLSLLMPRLRDAGTTDDHYRLICGILVHWLRTHEIQATVGSLLGSYCDGKYNVLVGGRKLVGTAQAWRGGLAGMTSNHPGYILAHACVTVDYDMVEATRIINQFYSESGQDIEVASDTSVTLAEFLPGVFRRVTPFASALFAKADLADFLLQHLHKLDALAAGS